ncbi:MAG: hypothetical protein ABI307_05235 [Mycobacterium sp.]
MITNTADRRQRKRYRRQRLALAPVVAALAIGGCAMFSHDRRDELDGPALTDEQTRSQVGEPAKQIVKAAGLQGLFPVFRFESCNDQNEAPYRGVAEVGFTFPANVDEQAYIDQVAAAMAGLGWSEGPPPGKMPYGRVLHTEQLMAIMAPLPDDRRYGDITIYGQCRNLTDHRKDEGPVYQDFTEELTG